MKSRNICWTKNNYGEWRPTTEDTLYTIYGYEVGENGTPHLQGFSQFKHPVTQVQASNKLGGCHCEIMRGTCKQARDYCLKDGNFFEIGDFSEGQGSRRELTRAVNNLKENAGNIKELAMEEPETFVKFHAGLAKLALYYQNQRRHEPEVIVFYGPTGTGKSRAANELAPHAYWKPPGSHKWWDGYCNDLDIIIDDFSIRDWPREYILRLCDRYPMKVETKGGFTEMVARRIIITTNDNPNENWPPELIRRCTRLHEVAGNNEPPQ